MFFSKPYLYEGYHYAQDAGAWGRGAPVGLSIAKIDQKEDLVYVTCDTNVDGRTYFVLEPKTIGGSVYWTLHYATTEAATEVPGLPELPEGFDYEAPALPPGAIDGGTCGDDVAWTLDQNRLLTITGTGEIAENFFWYFNVSDVVIADGINGIGRTTFVSCHMSSITIPTSVTSIGEWAFSGCDNLTDVYYRGTKEQWEKISIGDNNEPLLSATIHFMGQSSAPNPTPTPGPEPTPTPTPTPKPGSRPTSTPNSSSDPESTPTPTPNPTPTPTPTGPVTKTDTASDGTVTATITWPDGKTAVKTQTPQGDMKLVVTASTGATVANISIPASPGPSKQYTDVQSGWYKDSVDKATALGLFSGTGANTFSPGAPMTRGMLATVLYRLSGKVKYGLGTGNFPDVANGAWYKDAVDWAQATGVITGTGNGFEPNTDITREQLVTMLYRYAQLIGLEDKKAGNITGFADYSSVSGYAQDAMKWAVAEGFIKGVGKRLDPAGKATRAQVAAVLTRFTDYLQQ